MLSSLFLIPALLPSVLVHGAAIQHHDGPNVQVGAGTVIGTRNGSIDSFLGVPYAHPPVGDLRLRLPRLLTSYHGVVNATAFGNQCLQHPFDILPNTPAELLEDGAPLAALFAPNDDVPHSEDCLNLNIVRPAHLGAHAKLPVLVWIYGGGFSTGSNAMALYNGTPVVQKSIDIGEPVIYVAMNYRLNAFGFLGGREVKKAGLGNLGLQDQRTALRWVQKYISAFGGDPNKVTIWGESAGAISVSLHMLANEGRTEGLFRAAIMNSGSPIPTGDIIEVQDTYDFVVNQVGCSSSPDTLACLRTVSADSILNAVSQIPDFTSYVGLATPWVPRADGVFITQPPLQLALKGNLAKIPFITGDVKDEGTQFTLGTFNITTDEEFATYMSQVCFPASSPADISRILELYPSDPSAGSPFDTGNANAFSPEYKRLSAVVGDWFFHAPRRQLLSKYSSTQPAYNFLNVRDGLPGMGYAHGIDLANAFGPGDMTEYFVRFVNHLNPNFGHDGVQWPPFNIATRSTLEFDDGDTPLRITPDIDRVNGTDELFSLSLRFPF